MKPYTYLVGWSEHNLWYYGVKYGKNADPELFWKNYFTSSKQVLSLRKILGEPNIIQVRKVFNTQKAAINWEYRVIIRMKMITNSKWLNATSGHLTNHVKAFTKEGKACVVNRDDYRFKSGELVHYNKGKSIFVDSNGKAISMNSIEAHTLGLEGFTKGKQSGENNPFFGRTHTEETLAKLRVPRPNAIIWNKGKKVNYGEIWRKSLLNRKLSGEDNPSFGKKWLKNLKTLQKVYTSNNELIEYLLNSNTGWEFGSSKKIKLNNITNEIQYEFKN